MTRTAADLATRKVFRALRRCGCVEERHSGGHTIFKTPSGGTLALPAHKPVLLTKDLKTWMERAGLDWCVFLQAVR